MTKELKFDRARFDAGEMPTRTRNGTKVLWCAATGLHGAFAKPIVAIFEGNDDVYRFDDDGYWCGGIRSFDLVHEPRTVKVRVGIRRAYCAPEFVTTSDLREIGVWRGNGTLLGEHTFEVEE